MSAFNFPASPSNGDTYTANGVTFTYSSSSTAWQRSSAVGAQGAAGAQGATGPTGAQGATGSTGAQGAANATTINNNANNRLITGSGTANTLEGESKLTFDTSTTQLKITRDDDSNSGLYVFHDDGNEVGHFSNVGSGNEGILVLKDSGTDTVVLNGATGENSYINSGKFGIGTNNPSVKTQIYVTNTTAYSASTIDANQFQLSITNAGAAGVAGILLATEPSSGNGGHCGIRALSTGNGNSDLTFSTRGSSTSGERLRIHASGKVSIGSPETSTGLLLLDKNLTAESDVSDKNNYHLVIRSQTNSNTAKIGIAFADTTNDEHVGAAILHHRETTDSVGSLAFYTSQNSGTTAERFRITRYGELGLSGANFGTNGQVLTSQGSGSAVQWATVSSDFVKISSTTMSGEAAQFELDFDTSTYKYFKIYLTGLNLSYDANLYVRFKVSGTIQTGNNYYGGTIKKHSGGFDNNTYGGQNQNYGYLTHNVGGNDGTYERYSAVFDINCGEASRGMPFLRHDSFYKDSAGNHANTMGIVGWQNWNQINGIRFYASSGNINHAKFDLYGIK